MASSSPISLDFSFVSLFLLSSHIFTLFHSLLRQVYKYSTSFIHPFCFWQSFIFQNRYINFFYPLTQERRNKLHDLALSFLLLLFPSFFFSFSRSLSFLFYYLIFPSSFSCFSLRLFLCLFLSVQPLSSSSSVVFFKFCVHHLLRVSVNAWFIKFFLSLITFLFLILTATAVQTVPQALHTSVFQFFFLFTFILLSTYRYIFHQHSWIDTAPYICTPNVRVSISRQDKNNFCGWFLRGHLTSRGQWL